MSTRSAGVYANPGTTAASIYDMLSKKKKKKKHTSVLETKNISMTCTGGRMGFEGVGLPTVRRLWAFGGHLCQTPASNKQKWY